jgi:hypothetical protein
MKNKRLSFTALSALLVALLAWVVPLRADNVDQRIKALEDELTRLKTEQQQVKTEQIELRKDALAAEQALPKFEYRAGDGLTISAADEAWQFNLSLRLNIHMYNFTNGRSNFIFGSSGPTIADRVSGAGTPSRATHGSAASAAACASGAAACGGNPRVTNTDPLEFYPRRVRLYMNYCWEDCFWEIQTSIDGETAPRQANWRDNEVLLHFEKWNPYLPFFSFGLRRGAGRTYEGRSSSNDGKLEHPIILEGFSWGGDGSHAGAGIGWDRVPVATGDFQLFLNWASSQQNTWQDYNPTTRSGMMGFIGTRPFSKLKDQKWISGLDVGFGWQFQSIDNPALLPDGNPGATEIRVRNSERRGRQDWFRPGAIDNTAVDTLDNSTTATTANPARQSSGQNVGSGFASVFIPGFQWRVGPYKARFNYITTRYADNNDGIGGVWGYGFDVGHDLYVWSPKGFFTGSPSTPGSIMASYNYEHGIMSCGHNCDASPGNGAFHNQSYVLNQTSLWYWIRPALRVGMWWNYWGFANSPGQTQIAVGCTKDETAFSNISSNANKRVGKSCWWNSVNLGFQLTW